MSRQILRCGRLIVGGKMEALTWLASCAFGNRVAISELRSSRASACSGTRMHSRREQASGRAEVVGVVSHGGEVFRQEKTSGKQPRAPGETKGSTD